MLRPQEHWRNFELIGALLREEERKFSTRSGPYLPSALGQKKDPFAKLVENVEDSIHREREETIVMRTTQDRTSDG